MVKNPKTTPILSTFFDDLAGKKLFLDYFFENAVVLGHSVARFGQRASSPLHQYRGCHSSHQEPLLRVYLCNLSVQRDYTG